MPGFTESTIEIRFAYSQIPGVTNNLNLLWRGPFFCVIVLLAIILSRLRRWSESVWINGFIDNAEQRNNDNNDNCDNDDNFLYIDPLIFYSV